MKSSGHNTVTSTLINKDGTPNSENVHKDKSGKVDLSYIKY